MPYPTLMAAGAPPRACPPRDVSNALRGIVPTGAPGRSPPGDSPPRPAVDQQPRRWRGAGVSGAVAHDVRGLLRRAAGRADTPTAAIFGSATRPSTPGSGRRAGGDGRRERKGSKSPLAVATLGGLLAPPVTPADGGDRARVAAPAAAAPEATGGTVERVSVDRGNTGAGAAAAAAYGVRPEVAELPEGERGVALPPRRWVVERSFARAARWRRLAADDERWPAVAAGLHSPAFVSLMLHRLVHAVAPTP